MIVPRIIPKRRILVIGITLIFCSAILMTSSSIFISILSLNADLYGTGDDIVIIYDTDAQTPFTSSVPQSINQALKQHVGVVETSGEILIPIIVKNEPAFVRGVSFSDFSFIYPTTILQGDSFNDTDKGLVLIGDKIAQRMNLAVGDYLRIGSTIRNQEIRAVVGGIFHSEHDGHNDEILTSITFARSLSAQQNDFTHIIVKIDRSITSAKKIFDYVSTLHKVTIRAFRKNGTEQLKYWKLTVFDYKDVRIHSKGETGTTDLYLPFGEYSFQASDGSKNSYITKLEITENTSLDIQVDPLVFEVNIYAHYNGTPAVNQYFEILDVKRNVKSSGYTDIEGKSNFELRAGAYSVRFWQESVKKDFGIRVLSQLFETFDLSKIGIPHATFNGFSNRSILINNIGHLSLTENMDQSIFKFDNSKEIKPLMNRIYYNLTDGDHNLTVNRPNNRKSIFFFTVDSTFSVLNPIKITNYAEITPQTLLNFSLVGVNYAKFIKIYVNNLEYHDSIQNKELLQFKLTDNYVGPLNITLVGYTIGNQDISKQFTFYVTETPDPMGIVGQRNNVYLRKNDVIKLWHTYNNYSITIDDQELEENNDQIIIPELALGPHFFNITNELGNSFLKEFNVVSNYSHLVRIINESSNFTLDLNVNFEEDNLKLDYNPYLFSLRAISAQYSIRIIPNITFPTVLNGESIQYIEITSLITHMVENVILINSAPNIDPYVPVTEVLSSDLLVDGRISSFSPINETLGWSFDFLNSSVKYPNIPEPIVLTGNNQILLAPGYWEVTVLNSQTSITWITYVPMWRRSLEVNGSTEIQVDGYKLSAENMSLHLFDGYAYFINDRYYYYRSIINETNIYSRHFNLNEITIELPDWKVFAEYTTYIENETSSYIYNGTTSFVIPSESYSKQSFKIEFHIVDYYGYSSSYNQTFVYNVPGAGTTINIIDNINISTEYELILISKNTMQIKKYHLNTSSFHLNLMDGNWEIEVQSLDLHFNFIRPVKAYINLTLSLYNITAYANNINFEEFMDYTGNLKVENIITGEAYYYRYDYTNKLKVSNSIYNITTLSDRTSGSEIVIINNNHRQVIINSDIINETGSIKLVGGQGIDPETATIRHINTNILKSLSKTGELWLVKDFPVGDVYVTITQGGFKTDLIGWFEPSFHDLVLYVDNSTLSIGDWLGKGGVIQVNDASFGADAVSGPLSYTKVIIAAEILIIVLSLIVNISGVFSGLVSESRNEIKTARSIGFSRIQVLTGILRDLWYVGIISTIIGGLLGMAITSLLFNSDSTILFGHRFVPEFSLVLWLVNFASINIIAILGGIIGLKLEAEIS